MAKSAKRTLHTARASGLVKKPATKKPAEKNTLRLRTGVQKAYDEISSSWDERRRGPFPAMPLFVEEFQKRFSKSKGTLSHAKILDAGCGNARNALWLSKRLPRACIYCCDISAGMLHSASKNVAAACRAHSFAIRKARIENTGYPPALFDAVLCTAVLHHVQNRKGWVRALAETRRVLKPDGFAFVTVWSDSKTKAGSDGSVGFPAGKGNNVQRFYHFFTRRELAGAAKTAGFEVADSFFEAKGKKTGIQNKSKARNLCVILQNPRRKHEGKRKIKGG